MSQNMDWCLRYFRKTLVFCPILMVSSWKRVAKGQSVFGFKFLWSFLIRIYVFFLTLHYEIFVSNRYKLRNRGGKRKIFTNSRDSNEYRRHPNRSKRLSRYSYNIMKRRKIKKHFLAILDSTSLWKYKPNPITVCHLYVLWRDKALSWASFVM